VSVYREFDFRVIVVADNNEEGEKVADYMKS